MARVAIRAVCFDATGTLFETRESVGSVYSRAAAAVGVKLPAWRLDDAFRRVMQHGPDLAAASSAPGSTRAEREAAEIAWWRDRVRQTFQATDSTVRFADPEALFRELFDHYRDADAWQLRPGVRALLERLRREGYRLGVASNFDHRLPKILEALGINGFFDALEIPILRGQSKPARGVFDALAAALFEERDRGPGRELQLEPGVGTSAKPGLDPNPSPDLEALAYVGDDAPAILAAIAAHGLRVFDVRSLPDLAALALRLATDAGAGAANLAPSAAPSNPARAEE